MSTPSAARLIDAPIAYLAGPEVFLPNAMEIGAEKIAICRAHGIDALFPFEDTQRDGATAADRGHALFLDCVEMMERCNLGIVNMTPFRGVSMDVGTAVELGYMHARGHPVFGYTNVTLDYEARVSDEFDGGGGVPVRGQPHVRGPDLAIRWVGRAHPCGPRRPLHGSPGVHQVRGAGRHSARGRAAPVDRIGDAVTLRPAAAIAGLPVAPPAFPLRGNC